MAGPSFLRLYPKMQVRCFRTNSRRSVRSMPAPSGDAYCCVTKVTGMRLGLIHINMGPMTRPEALVSAARAAEAAGFDSVWAGEHLLLPDPQAPPSPMAPQDPILDSLI